MGRIALGFATAAVVIVLATPALADGTIQTMPECSSCTSWTVPSGQGVGLGLSIFGNATAEEVDANILVPFGWLFALRARPVAYFGFEGAGAAIGAKLEAVFRSKVIWNFARVYAGGGPAVFYGLSGPTARQVDGNWFAGDVNGNWFAGTEIFFDPRCALHWELGTSGGALGTGTGPYADVGLEFYPF